MQERNTRIQSFRDQHLNLIRPVLQSEASNLDKIANQLNEAGHIADIEEKMDIAGGMHQEKMIDIAVEERDSVDLAQLAGEDS